MLKNYTKFIPYVGVLVVCVVLFLYWNSRTSDINDLRLMNSALQAELVTKEAAFKENERRLKNEISDQNQKIAAANAEFNRLERESAIAVENARKTSLIRVQQLEQQLTLLRNIPTPQTCEDSVKLLVDIGVANPWPTK